MIEIKDIDQKVIWEKFLAGSSQCNFLQSWNWGEVHRQLGHKIFRIGFYDGTLKGLALIVKQNAKRGSYFECPAGPIVDWQDKNMFSAFIDFLRREGKAAKCVFARVRPQILSGQANSELFAQFGFGKAPMHLHAQDTWVLDISPQIPSLLSGMRKTTRYSIKKAYSLGITIEKSTDPKDVEILFNLQKDTVKRHGFIPFSQQYFTSHFDAFIKDGQILIFKAVWQEKVISIAMIVFYHGRATYHYSASASAYLHLPASYLIQWEAIQEARKRGCNIYDFWGIAPPGSKHHRFSGVTLFKTGFGGYPISYLPAQDLPLRWDYPLVYLFETARKKLRNL